MGLGYRGLGVSLVILFCCFGWYNLVVNSGSQILQGSDSILPVGIFKGLLNSYLGWLAVEIKFGFEEIPDSKKDGVEHCKGGSLP